MNGNAFSVAQCDIIDQPYIWLIYGHIYSKTYIVFV